MSTRRLALCKSVLGCLWLPLAFVAWLPVCSAQEAGIKKPIPTVDQIVAAMVSRNEARTAALQGYVGGRMYELQSRGFPSDRSAEMVVEVRYVRPATKQFTVVSESGSKFIIDHVLKRLVSGEQEAEGLNNRKETALTPRNYRFDLLGQEITGQRRLYVLKVLPRVKNKFAYRGKIWIDGADFAIVKIEAEPAKSPSFWISHTHVEEEYAKFGCFWLPVQNTSTSKIRVLDGTATLRIEYQDYAMNGSLATVESPAHTATAF
jgi:hypothetical protein